MSRLAATGAELRDPTTGAVVAALIAGAVVRRASGTVRSRLGA